MQNMVIRIDSAGGVKSLYNEKASLADLGQQRIERVSLVCQDFDSQSFFICPPNTAECDKWQYARCPVYGRFPSYKSAVDFEVSIVNRCLTEGVHDMWSVRGLHIAGRLRGRHGQ